MGVSPASIDGGLGACPWENVSCLCPSNHNAPFSWNLQIKEAKDLKMGVFPENFEKIELRFHQGVHYIFLSWMISKMISLINSGIFPEYR